MNVHEDFSRKDDADGPSDRSFGLTLGIFFLLVGMAPLLRARPVRWWAVAPSAILLIAAAVSPSVLRLPNRLWMRLAWLISKITNPIITGLMFYLLFTPAAIICRWTGNDLLRLKFDDTLDSYWMPRQPPGPPPESMRNQF